MKKGLFALIAIVVVIGMYTFSVYNSMVKLDESINGSWSNVETQYQRRADLIPNLVNTVKGYAAHEQQTLTGVTEARSKATSMNVNVEDLTPETLAAYQQAQGAVGSALGRLIALSESYPDLKANQNFQELQVQLEGTENRIAVARTSFNDTVKKFNSKVRMFPTNIVAGLFSFSAKPYFEAEQGTERAPEVVF